MSEHFATLCAQGLTIRRGGRAVLSDVDLRIAAGECVAIIGPNGAGKTTLLLGLLGLLAPARGAVQLDGRAVQHVAPRTRARFAGYVPQSLAQTPALAVRDVIAGGRYAHTGLWQRWRAADEAAVTAALARCGLTALAERALNTLSGGERQKTLIAAAMAQDAQMLFLDEPNAALDPAYQLELVGILRGWLADGGGIVLVSHDLHLPAALGGRVVALRAGRIAADGPAPSILTADTLARIYEARFGVATTAEGHIIVMPEWWLVRA
jgi:iron complex transport system ATP-binding protein